MALAPALLAAGLLLAASCGEGRVFKAETGPTWSHDGTRVAFASDGDVYVMGIDGAERTNLTGSPERDFDPIWSPDGTAIAYQTQGRSGPEINVIGPDGTGKANVTSIPARYQDLAWSPDGSKIAFASDRAGWESGSEPGAPVTWELYVANSDGTGDVRLTFDDAAAAGPTWSPDGATIAFQSDADGDSEIYAIGADGSGLRRLTDNGWPDVSPAWSPDGEHIAFVSGRPKTEFQSDVFTGLDLYLMNADGTGQFALTNVPDVNFTRPSWSPDGGFLVFDGRYTTGIFNQQGIGQKGINEIYAMRMEGLYEFSRLTENKTNNPDLHGGPVWSPNSRTIAFLSQGSGVPQVSISRVIDSDDEICRAGGRAGCF